MGDGGGLGAEMGGRNEQKDRHFLSAWSGDHGECRGHAGEFLRVAGAVQPQGRQQPSAPRRSLSLHQVRQLPSSGRACCKTLMGRQDPQGFVYVSYELPGTRLDNSTILRGLFCSVRPCS